MPFNSRTAVRVFAAIAPITLSSAAFAGPDWTEVGDAGSFFDTAQAPLGVAGTALNTISGTLAGGNLVPDLSDCFFIRILNPATFSITVGTADFNAQLFLFNITVTNQVYGLLANNDQSEAINRPLITGTSTDGPNPVVVPAAGDYLLAISGLGHNPFSQTGAIFNFASNTEISRADGPGGLNPLTNWQGQGQTGSYTIQMTGVGIPGIPSPGSAVLLGLASLAAGHRARR